MGDHQVLQKKVNCSKKGCFKQGDAGHNSSHQPTGYDGLEEPQEPESPMIVPYGTREPTEPLLGKNQENMTQDKEYHKEEDRGHRNFLYLPSG